MNLCLCFAVFSFSLFSCCKSSNGLSDFRLLDQNFNEIEDDELLDKLQKLETQLKRNLFYIPTDKVITDVQVNHVIHAVSLNSNIKLADAVAAIVNVKLIRRLQFESVARYFVGCANSLDPSNALQYLTVGNEITSNGPEEAINFLDLDSSEDVGNGDVENAKGVLYNICTSSENSHLSTRGKFL